MRLFDMVEQRGGVLDAGADRRADMQGISPASTVGKKFDPGTAPAANDSSDEAEKAGDEQAAALPAPGPGQLR